MDQVGYCGLNSVFGRVTTSLLKQSPCIQKLTIYDDETGSSPGPSPHQANLYIGQDSLFDALKDVNIVVIGDECYDLPDSDRLKLTGRKIKRYTEAIMQCSPTAIVVIAASPLNVVVPLASYMLGPDFSKRVLGSTSHDTLRASRLLNGLLSDRYQTHRLHVLPVIGGATQNTKIPLFSQIYPQICMTDAIREKILDRMRLFNTPSYQELDAIERAYSTVRFVHSLIVGITRGSPVPEITLSRSVGQSGFEFLSRPALLGDEGVQREFPLPDLDTEEERILYDVTERLNTDAQSAVDLANHLHDENEEERDILGSIQSLATDDINRTISNSNRNDNFLEDLYKTPFAKIEENTQVVLDRHMVNDNFRKEQKDYPGRVENNRGALPIHAPWVHSKTSHNEEVSDTNLESSTTQDTQDASIQSSKPNGNCMSLHASRLLKESPGEENEFSPSADIPQENAELLNDETDTASDVLQEEVSKHLETLKSPIKSATQKFVELQQAKELEGDNREAHSDSCVLADSESISAILNTTAKENQLKMLPQKQNPTKIQPRESNEEVASVNCLTRRPEQKLSHHEDKFSKFATANKEHAAANHLPRNTTGQESSKRLSAQQEVSIKNENPAKQAKKFSDENKPTTQLESKDELVVDKNGGTEYFCVAENIKSSEKETTKIARSNVRRPKSTPNFERTYDSSSLKKDLTKSSKQNKPGIKYGKDQTSKGKTVGKLIMKKSKNNIHSVSPKGMLQKTAREIEPSRPSAVSKALTKPFRKRSKTKTATEMITEVADTPTPQKTTETQSEKFSSYKRHYDLPTTAVDHRIVEAEPSLINSSNMKARETKPVLLMSGHSDPEKPSTKSIKPHFESQKSDGKKEGIEPEKSKILEPSLNPQTGASRSEEIPEVQPEVEEPAVPGTARTRKLLTTDRTKDYYIRERRVPLDKSTCSSCNRDSGLKTENLTLNSKTVVVQPEVETRDSEDELKAVLPTEEPKINSVNDEKKLKTNHESIVDEEHNIDAKWDSKYLSMASDMLYKFFKDAKKQSKNVNEVKSKFLSDTNDTKVEIQPASIYKQLNDFGDPFNYQKDSKVLLREISLDDFASSGRVKIGLGKSRLSASELNYKRKAKYTDAKFKHSKPKRKASAGVMESGKIIEKQNVRLHCAKSSRRIPDQNRQKNTGETAKPSNAKLQEKSRTRGDKPGQTPPPTPTEMTPAVKPVRDDKKVDFDQLFKESSQIPILEIRSQKMFGNKVREMGETLKNVRPLSKLQANTQKLEDVVSVKLPKVTPDKRRDAVKLFDFSISPKSDLPNTDSWDHCIKSEPRKKPSVDRNVRKGEAGVTTLELTTPKPSTSTGNIVPISSKTIKQANLGQLGNSGPLRRNNNVESPKPNKWERVFTVFKQILMNDVEGKSSGNDSHPAREDFTSDDQSANSDDDLGATNSRYHKNRPSRLEKPALTSQTHISSRLSKTHKSQTAIQKKKHLVEGLKRRKFVPKNSPKKIVNYFSQRVEPSEPQKLANVSGSEMPSVK